MRGTRPGPRKPVDPRRSQRRHRQRPSIAKKRNVDWSALIGQRWCLTRGRGRLSRDYLMAHLTSLNLPFPSDLVETNSFLMILTMMQAEDYLTMVPLTSAVRWCSKARRNVVQIKAVGPTIRVSDVAQRSRCHAAAASSATSCWRCSTPMRTTRPKRADAPKSRGAIRMRGASAAWSGRESGAATRRRSLGHVRPLRRAHKLSVKLRTLYLTFLPLSPGYPAAVPQCTPEPAAMANNGIALRTETIGSFLRPRELTAAREAFNDGDPASSSASARSRSDLTALEDRCIREVVKLQEETGLDVVTDGEFRRSIYFEGFLNMIEGVEMKPLQGPTAGFVSGYSPPRTHVTGKLRWPKGGATVREFEFLKAATRAVPKITLPSPLHSLFFIDDSRVDRHVYPNLDDMWRDLEEVYAQELRRSPPHRCLRAARRDDNRTHVGPEADGVPARARHRPRRAVREMDGDLDGVCRRPAG